MLKEDEISILNMLISSLEENVESLKKAFEIKNHEEFNKIKKTILKIQKEISEILI